MAGPAVPRPAPDEYAPVFHAEVGLVPDAPDFAALLEAQLQDTRALVRRFGDPWADLRHAPGKWTVRETLGHLSDCERVLSYRLLRVLRCDPTPVPGFDHVAYVPAGSFESRTLADVAEEFASVRAATTALVRSARPEAFDGRLPVGSGAITGRALAYVIAGHERHHQALLRARSLPFVTDAGSRHPEKKTARSGQTRPGRSHRRRRAGALATDGSPRSPGSSGCPRLHR